MLKAAYKNIKYITDINMHKLKGRICNITVQSYFELFHEYWCCRLVYILHEHYVAGRSKTFYSSLVESDNLYKYYSTHKLGYLLPTLT